MSLAALGPLHFFPVRHHSPRSTAVLRTVLDEVQPEVVLVEGPDDANDLIAPLVDPETEPPVAILGYRTDGKPASSLWPFAAYSPEYAALRWAVEKGARAAFIDIPAARALGRSEVAEGEGESRDPDRPDLNAACADARGLRSFEEFWEAAFEAPAYDPAAFRAALLAYADLVLADSQPLIHRARDAYMARKIEEVVASGVRAERIVVVVGAAHAARFVASDVDASLVDALPASVPSAVTLIPFSFPRLAGQLGYGAGNRAPRYYQRAHDAGCDFRRATLEVLVDFTEHLRLRGFMASLADTIEAYRLACMLSDLRGKAGPGLDEVREATVATMCRGDATHVDTFLWPTVIGKSVGRVAARIGRNSLQEEFWREVRERKLPAQDAPESFVLRLNNEVEVGTSVFLHRLRVSDVPYASFTGSHAAASRAASEPAGGVAALGRVREVWEAQWTPSTDAALVEKIVLGDSLQEVVERVLEARLGESRATGAAAEILLESVVAAAPRATASSLATCERLASDDDDLPSLARGARALSGLVAYGTSRAQSQLGDEALLPLCRKTFDRAVLRVRDACTGNTEAVAPAKEALKTLHDIALSQPLVDRDGWFENARSLVESYAVHPATSGLAAGLLYLAQVLGENDIAVLVGQRLSNALEPEQGAEFLAGFLEVNALVLVRSRPVVEALDGFLAGIDVDRFRDTLPVLRRAFSTLGATERRYLLENVLAVRKIQDKAAATAVIQEKDKETLKKMSAELDKAIGDLDDLL